MPLYFYLHSGFPGWFILYYLIRVIPQIIGDQIQTIEVPFGSKSRIVLPDSSVVTLNSGSSLKYSSSDFNSDNRNVSLTGEGFFSVTKDSTKPFYVITPGIKVKVLGTTFNLKAYPDENIEEATLIEGKVEIYASTDKKKKVNQLFLNQIKAQYLVNQQDCQTSDTIQKQ